MCTNKQLLSSWLEQLNEGEECDPVLLLKSDFQNNSCLGEWCWKVDNFFIAYIVERMTQWKNETSQGVINTTLEIVFYIFVFNLLTTVARFISDMIEIRFMFSLSQQSCNLYVWSTFLRIVTEIVISVSRISRIGEAYSFTPIPKGQILKFY